MVLQNRLLQLLSRQAIDMLSPQLVTLGMRQHLDGAAETGKVYFIETGVASVIADTNGNMAVELGIVGRE